MTKTYPLIIKPYYGSNYSYTFYLDVLEINGVDANDIKTIPLPLTKSKQDLGSSATRGKVIAIDFKRVSTTISVRASLHKQSFYNGSNWVEDDDIFDSLNKFRKLPLMKGGLRLFYGKLKEPTNGVVLYENIYPYIGATTKVSRYFIKGQIKNLRWKIVSKKLGTFSSDTAKTSYGGEPYSVELSFDFIIIDEFK